MSRVDDVASISMIEGVEFVQGSLNLVSNTPVWLDAGSAIYKSGAQLFWRASLEGTPVILNRWVGGCPVHVFEVFAAVRLRDVLGLEDGDAVNLEIPDEIVSRSDASLLGRLLWQLFWRYRTRQIYHDGGYLTFVRSRAMSRYTWRTMQSG